jgi:hypothetical protein
MLNLKRLRITPPSYWQEGKIMEKILNYIAYTVLAIFLFQLALYPIAAITGWQYHMDWGFTLWRQP